MLRWLWVLAAVGAASSTSAAELEHLRGSAPAYTVSQMPPPLPAFAAPPPASLPRLGPLPLAGPPPVVAARPVVAVVRPVTWNWTGFYFGANAGLALASSTFADPFGTSVFGDTARSPGFMGGGQIGFNWQAPGWRWVLGVEADADAISSDGTTTCFAPSALTVNATCRARPQSVATLTGRIGYAMGPGDELQNIPPIGLTPTPPQAFRATAEQAGVFLQGAYRFGADCL